MKKIKNAVFLFCLLIGSNVVAQVHPVYFADVIKEGDEEVLRFDWRPDYDAYDKVVITDINSKVVGEVAFPQNVFDISGLKGHDILYVTAVNTSSVSSTSVRVDLNKDYSHLYAPTATEQITVYTQTGENARFVKSQSGEEFMAKGVNFSGLRHGDHDTFEPDMVATQGLVDKVQEMVNTGSYYLHPVALGDTVQFYDPYRTETLMRTMKENGYNLVRVFLKTGERGSLTTGVKGMSGDIGTEGLCADYMDNFMDFMVRAQKYGLYVMPCFADNEMMDNIEFKNLSKGATKSEILFSQDGLNAKKRYIELFLKYIKDVDATLINNLFALTMQNEFYFRSDMAPFDQLSGTYTFLNDSTYDMGNDDERRALANAAMKNYFSTMKSTIQANAPGLLLGEGTFAMGAVGKTYENSKGIREVAGVSDLRFPMTAVEYLNTDIDFLDYHLYRWGQSGTGEDVFNYFADNMKVTTTECADLMESKPILMGEFGSFINDETSIGAASTLVKELQTAALRYGFKGSIYWTISSFEQSRLWNLMSEDAEILDDFTMNLEQPMTDNFVLEWDLIASAYWSDFYIRPPLGDPHQDDYFQTKLQFAGGNGEILLFNSDYQSGLVAPGTYVTNQNYNFKSYMSPDSKKQTIMYKKDTDPEWTVLFEDVLWGYGYTPVGRIDLPQNNITITNVKATKIFDASFNVKDASGVVSGASVIMDGDTLTTDASGDVLFADKAVGTYDYSVTGSGYGTTYGSVEISEANIADTLTLDSNRNFTFPTQTEDFVLEFEALATNNWSDFFIKPPFDDVHQDDYQQVYIQWGGGFFKSYNSSYPSGLLASDGFSLNKTYEFKIYMLAGPKKQTTMYREKDSTDWIVLFDDLAWSYGYTTAGRIVLPQNNLNIYNVRTSRINSITLTVNDGTSAVVGASVIMDGDTLTTDISGNVVFTDKVGTFSYTISATGFEMAEGSVTAFENDVSKTVTLTPVPNYEFTPMTEDFILEFDAYASNYWSDFYIKPPLGDPHQDDYFQTRLQFGGGDIILFNGDYPSGLIANVGYTISELYNFRIYMYASTMRQVVTYKKYTESEYTVLFDSVAWSYGYTPVGRIVLPQNNISIYNIEANTIGLKSAQIVEFSDSVIKDLGLVVYPNPVISDVVIKSNSEIQCVKIFSVSGTLINDIAVGSEKEIAINLGKLSAGVYLIQVYSQNGSSTKRFVKK
ncbi:T9SS type A sorting domain-containing protein [Carboxylicivirga sp. RSCT41]|uniref:T9SS type A sorting domain-containing protein n=1 Tax=Carboxylicivirga agarovorans TaxID=3417570 RepID=UPI003D34DF9C